MSLSTQLQTALEGNIDFAGQALVEAISRYVLFGAAVVAFIAGFVLQSLSLTFYIYGGSVALLALVVLPPWPTFNAHPVEWLPSVEKVPSNNTRN